MACCYAPPPPWSPYHPFEFNAAARGIPMLCMILADCLLQLLPVPRVQDQTAYMNCLCCNAP